MIAFIQQWSWAILVSLSFVGSLISLHWKIAQLAARYSDAHSSISIQFKHVDNQFKRVDEQFKRVDNQFKRVDDKIDGLSTRVSKMEGILSVIAGKIAPDHFSQTHSPRSLTEEGKVMSEKLCAKDTIARLYPDLIVKIDAAAPKTAYDIQQEAFSVTRGDFFQLLTDEELEAIKDQAFKTGEDIYAFSIIYGIILRDLILKERGFATNEIDKHDL